MNYNTKHISINMTTIPTVIYEYTDDYTIKILKRVISSMHTTYKMNIIQNNCFECVVMFDNIICLQVNEDDYTFYMKYMYKNKICDVTINIGLPESAKNILLKICDDEFNTDYSW